MTTTSISAVTHSDYDFAQPFLKMIRDCVIGSPKIKSETYTYLPHPSQVDQSSTEQQARYADFLAGAEFDGFPDETRRELLGKMRIDDSTIELDARLDYLIDDVDGDGTSLASAIEFTANNVFQTKWHVLVSEYKGAPAEMGDISKAEAETMNMRSVIKQYCRENVVNWNFSRVNGVMQLSYIQFLEICDEFDQMTGNSEQVEKYLTLALDDEGYYYQVKTEDGASQLLEDRNYPRVNGQMLTSIPLNFVADEELAADSLPVQLGYLYAICDMSLARYRVSADYKETQRNVKPTIMTKGWTVADPEIFKEANNGRTYIATGAGAVNNLPNNVEADVLSVSAEMNDYHWYFETNEKKIRSLGGDANTQNTAMTATEANITATKQNALLNTIADNLEQAYKRAVYLCGMFDGVYTGTYGDAVDSIIIELPRDFATPKLLPEEVTEYRNDYLNGLMSKDDYVRTMIKGGWRDGEVEVILAELEESPPIVVVNPTTPSNESQTS